jgi:predicted ATP-grasp superfamily ATP-dependent carboligase
MKRINVLLTSVGGILTQPLISNFYKQAFNEKINLKIFGIDNNDKLTFKNNIDYFEKSPLGNDSKYSTFIESFIKQNKINIVFPRSDEEAMKIAKLKSQNKLNKTFIAVSEYQELKIINDKISTYRILDKTQLAFNFWKICYDKKSLFQHIQEYLINNKSCVIKPSDSRGGRDVYYLSNTLKEENKYLNISNFKKIIKSNKLKYPIILMEELKDKIYDVDVLCDKGNLINLVVRERIISNNPNAGNIILNPNKYKDTITDLVKLFKLDGIHDFDIMFDKNDSLKIIEINPRMSGSFAIASSFDENLLINIFRKYLKKPYKKSNKRIFGKKIFPEVKISKI